MLRARTFEAPCETHGTSPHRAYGKSARRAKCLACEREKRSEAGKRAVVTRKKRREKRARLGHGLQTYSELMKVCDELWSIYCRAEADRCMMCGWPHPPELLQWAHTFSRGKPKHLRYDPRAWQALCAPCHRRHTPQGPDWFRWVEQRLGKHAWERLQFEATARGKLRRCDLDLLILDVSSRIEALPAGERREWAVSRRDTVLCRMRTV